MPVRARVRRARRSVPELNITAFMNLMVVLVPFLLLSAVFSNLAIIELNLPPDNQQAEDNKKKERNFEVIVRKDSLVVADTLGGVIKRIPLKDGKQDFKALSDLLIAIKLKYPKKENISLLLEAEIPYDTLIQVMDTVRVVKVVEVTSVVRKELFPQIAIGDAP
ncbi:MAG: biopolymer transporter ExbD [Gammaproteobacteria bacterium]|nr:biopolymer transporter ExbD [Gammaproteobacteria bacterium]MCF6364241.1 biopolymer transporter ExbD [Gammaproteobacteria bacterium]